jgi:hypothetical protein
VRLAIPFGHPGVVFATIYVITDVPGPTGVIIPVFGSIVATEVVAEDQEPPDTVELKEVVLFAQRTLSPLSVPALGVVQLDAVQLNVSDAKHDPDPPIGVTVSATTSP